MKYYSITRIPTKRNIKERLKEGLKEFLTGVATGIFKIIVIFACGAAFCWMQEEAPGVLMIGILALILLGIISIATDAMEAVRQVLNRK